MVHGRLQKTTGVDSVYELIVLRRTLEIVSSLDCYECSATYERSRSYEDENFNESTSRPVKVQSGHASHIREY